MVTEVKKDFNPIQKISKILSEKGMTLQTVIKNKKKIIPVLKEYSKRINYKQGDKKFIIEVIKNLPNK